MNLKKEENTSIVNRAIEFVGMDTEIPTAQAVYGPPEPNYGIIAAKLTFMAAIVIFFIGLLAFFINKISIKVKLIILTILIVLIITGLVLLKIFVF